MSGEILIDIIIDSPLEIRSVALQHLIQLHDYSLKFLNDAPWGAK